MTFTSCKGCKDPEIHVFWRSRDGIVYKKAFIKDCKGCGHEATDGKKGLNVPSGETACMLCIRNPFADEWYKDAKKFLKLKWKFWRFIRWRLMLWYRFRKSKRRDMWVRVIWSYWL